MTEKRINELLAYYEASRNVLDTSHKNYPEKFNKVATEIALNLFDDTIAIIKYVKLNPTHMHQLQELLTQTTVINENSEENQ